MSQWESLRLTDVLDRIRDEVYVLPVIQRKLVWNEEKIENIFDSLLKGFSFGAIMTLRDMRDREPLFEFRPFIKDYSDGVFIFSRKVEKLDKDIYYVIDGQQRLSAFYIGLLGSYNSKVLFFDLLSEWKKDDFLFKFAREKDNLKKEIDVVDGNGKRRTFWKEVKNLYRELKETGGEYIEVYESIVDSEELSDEEKETIKGNIERFRDKVLNQPVIGLNIVRINRKKDKMKNRLIAVELFKRLNQGGTKLDALELMASTLKGLDSISEEFLYKDIKEFEDIGFSQDEVIKLIFLLQDNHRKNLTEIDEKDSLFIRKNRNRIISALKGTRQFLYASKLYDFYSFYKPSIIPLYFITYHLFHKSELKDEEIEKYFSNLENNLDYKLIYKWIYLSLLNRVFRRRGAGWTAYTTGVRKILDVVKNYKNKPFPTSELFEMYENHPLDFSQKIKSEWLEDYDFDFVMYVIYDKTRKFRKEDIDHIQPKSLLEKRGFGSESINTIGNLQLIDHNINRREKRDKELKNWIESLENKNEYIKKHLIPKDEELWSIKNYKNFLKERKKMIVDKLLREIQ